MGGHPPDEFIEAIQTVQSAGADQGATIRLVLREHTWRMEVVELVPRMSFSLLAKLGGPTSAAEAQRASGARSAGCALCMALIGWCVLIVCAGCTAGPDYVRPCPPGLYPVYQGGKGDETPPTDLTHWWTHFEDPVLDQLVTVAWQQNLDLRAAGFRILEARAQRGVVRGGLFPQVDNTESYRYKLASSNAKHD